MMEPSGTTFVAHAAWMGASQARGGRVSNVRRREHGTGAGPHMMNPTSRREDPLLRRSADAMSAQQTARASVHMAAVAAALANARRMAFFSRLAEKSKKGKDAGAPRAADTHQRSRRLHPPDACPRAQVLCMCCRASAPALPHRVAFFSRSAHATGPRARPRARHMPRRTADGRFSQPCLSARSHLRAPCAWARKHPQTPPSPLQRRTQRRARSTDRTRSS